MSSENHSKNESEIASLNLFLTSEIFCIHAYVSYIQELDCT